MSSNQKKIKELGKWITDLQKEEQDLIMKARKEGKSAKDIRNISSDKFAERRMYYEELQELQSEDIIKQASQYDVLLPDYDDESAWEQNDGMDRMLTLKSMTIINQKITAEKRERRKLQLQYFSTIVSFIIGFIGALTGLLSQC